MPRRNPPLTMQQIIDIRESMRVVEDVFEAAGGSEIGTALAEFVAELVPGDDLEEVAGWALKLLPRLQIIKRRQERGSLEEWITRAEVSQTLDIDTAYDVVRMADQNAGDDDVSIEGGIVVPTDEEAGERGVPEGYWTAAMYYVPGWQIHPEEGDDE